AMVLVCIVLSGCGHGEKAAPGLSVKFDRSTVVYESNGDGGPSRIDIANTGNVPLTIFKVDAGCACRRIEQKGLPATIKPGGVLGLPVRSNLEASAFERVAFAFDVETDLGRTRATAPLTALPRHRLSAGYLVNANLFEGDDWHVHLTHRCIYATQSEAEPKVFLRCPPRFSAAALESHSGDVAIAPGMRYVDTTYRITLNDRELGTFRDAISLVDSKGAAIKELPLLWERHPYIYCVPERALLSKKPTRVFLRCPDDRLEATKILSAPPGVGATITSPREVTISLSPSARGKIASHVDVATSDKLHPKFSIPVAKFE
ncbi:MAG: hypothetical protein ACP5XB_22440, partial [Isosphaeraceae bacterium]